MKEDIQTRTNPDTYVQNTSVPKGEHSSGNISYHMPQTIRKNVTFVEVATGNLHTRFMLLVSIATGVECEIR
jgi:hypothetical protein